LQQNEIGNVEGETYQGRPFQWMLHSNNRQRRCEGGVTPLA
jgi:hypothetical protein